MGVLTKVGRHYTSHPVLASALIGGLLGFFVLSPVSMVLEHTTHTSIEDMREHLRDLYLLKNPAWLGIFTLLGVSIGVLYGYVAKRIDDLQRNLYQAEKLASIGQLAAGVAHEINTPLSNISLNAENAKMKNREADLGENLEEISRQVDIASKIVKGLLEYSSPAGTEAVELNVNDLLRRASSFVGSLREEDVRVVESFQEDLPLIMGEPNSLQQAFSNIISNAYDAMPDGGVLEITTGVTDKGCVSVEFKDTGGGIPRESISRVFDPFYTTKDPGKGTGLGLSISQSIVRSHHGRLEVNSKFGEGTTVKVLIKR